MTVPSAPVKPRFQLSMKLKLVSYKKTSGRLTFFSAMSVSSLFESRARSLMLIFRVSYVQNVQQNCQK